VGYEALLLCASFALQFLGPPHAAGVPAALRAAVAPALEALIAKAVPNHARGSGTWLASESRLSASVEAYFARCQNAAAAAHDLNAADAVDAADAADAAAFHATLLPLWQSFLRVRPGGGDLFPSAGAFTAFVRAEADNGIAKMRSRLAAAAAAPSLRGCAHAACAAREAHAAQFKLCSACRAVCYCSKAHQAEDWPAHKAACKAARRAAAAPEAEQAAASGSDA
jgi:hypothetical protein